MLTLLLLQRCGGCNECLVTHDPLTFVPHLATMSGCVCVCMGEGEANCKALLFCKCYRFYFVVLHLKRPENTFSLSASYSERKILRIP